MKHFATGFPRLVQNFVHLIDVDPSKVLFIDTKFVTAKKHVPRIYLEISVIDSTRRIVLDTLISYGMTVRQFYDKCLVNDCNDRYFRQSMVKKVIGKSMDHPTKGMTIPEVAQALHEL